MPRKDQKMVPRNESNSLCRQCARHCRQEEAIRLVDCPRFLPLPFKIADPHYAQLDLFSDER